MKPSILNYSITAETSEEPDTKRQKSDWKTKSHTIAEHVESKLYPSLDELAKDLDRAASALLAHLNLPSGTNRTAQYLTAAPQDLEQATKILAFKKVAKELVARAKSSDNASGSATNGEETSKSLINGVTKPLTKLTATGDDKVVLTIFGRTQTDKQLFSSFQQVGDAGAPQPLREAALPPGITTTQIVPTPSSAPEKAQRITTIGELLGPSNLHALQPPKPSKVGNTRSSTVGWYRPTAAENTRGRSQVYFGQTVTTGHWLEYGHSVQSLDFKRRQRALSLSGGKAIPTAADEEHDAKELEASFRRAYSSFAPTQDNSAAVAPTATIQRIWWKEVGSKNYQKMIDGYTNEESSDEPEFKLEQEEPAPEELNLEEIKEVIDNWDQTIDPALKEEDGKTIYEKDVEEVLAGVSDLVETLHSYQRNRNLTRGVQPPPRPGFHDATASSAALKPSETEQQTYNILKSQLVLMISSLPPYAVAKLNSDQLEELSISTKIPIPADDRKGVMEEDDLTARAKHAALSTSRPQPAPPASTHRASSSSLYGNQYGGSTPRPAAPSTHSYYGSQTPVRPPTTGLQRPPQTAQGSLYTARPPTATVYQTSGAYKTPQYPHQVNRPSQPSYTQATPGQYFQTPAAQTYAPNNYQSAPQTAPQASMGGQYRAPSQQAYQPRPTTQNGLAYQYNNGIPRQASPQKNLYSPQPSTAQPPHRYSTPTPAITPQGRQQYYQPPMTNGTASRSPVPAPQQPVQSQPMQAQLSSGATGATGYHTVMTPAEQSNMMERQRAQLAQQHTTQHSARTAAQPGPTSTSPQPQTNGGSGVSAGT